MNFITQLLPGLRDVRGPLIAGYLWLFAGWLFLGEPTPDQETADAAYRPVLELGDALGRVGLAAVVSVAAYLIGSLFQAVVGGIDFTYKSLKERLRRFAYGTFSGLFLEPKSARELLYSAPVFSVDDFRRVDGDKGTAEALDDLVYTTLGSSMDVLNASLQAASGEVGAGVPSGCAEDETGVPRVEIGAVGTPARGWGVLRWAAATETCRAEERVEGDLPDLPRFSAARDLFGERSTIMTGLMETAEHAGSEVERLYAESDFRFTISFPLAVVGVALACESGDWWWLLLLVAGGFLLLHSIALRRQAGRELVEALRSRRDRDGLDRITPAFRRYDEDAEKLAGAMRDVNWKALAAAMEPEDEPSEVSAPRQKSLRA